jgi:imidazolonepropionase-like amidohydrolase
MSARFLAAGLSALFATSALAQTPTADLAKPPPGATHFIIESTGGKHGDSWSWTAPDGTRMARETWNLRGQQWDQDYTGKAGPDGMPASMVIRGVSPTGDAGETFSVGGGAATWKSPIDAGHTAYAAPAFYVPQGGPAGINAWFVERLLASPSKTLALLPSGKANAVKLTTTDVGQGATKQTITLWAISGLSPTPFPVWADAKGKFFGTTNVVDWLPETYAGEDKALDKVQAAAMAAQAPKIYKAVVKVPAGAVAFTHVKMFDADGLKFVADQTVVVERGVITAVGPAGSVKPPAGAQIIDGKGKTLVPGLWDCHMHFGDDFTGPQELSLGVTSVRDPGNNDVRTIDRRTRAAKGELLTPHVYPSSLIDGKGPFTAQVANVATSQAEAIALVDKAKANGFTGVKFYGTFNPAWLPAATAEAHKLGLHVHGHVPAGMRPLDAVRAGYDEVTHINFIMMQAMPQDVVDKANTAARLEGPAKYGKDVDLDSPAMKAFYAELVQRKTIIDPTLTVWEPLMTSDGSDLSPEYAPFADVAPPSVVRGWKIPGYPLFGGLTRDDFRKSFIKMVELVGRLHQAGVPIVAGTDGYGLELVRELELYQQAGLTNAESLQTATIVPARMTGMDDRIGSIAPGKTADIILVDGDVSKDITNLRHVRTVFLDGYRLDGVALRRASGLNGMPK